MTGVTRLSYGTIIRIIVNVNRLDNAKHSQVMKCLCDEHRTTVRITGVAKNTVAKLLVELGTACTDCHRLHVRGLQVQRHFGCMVTDTEPQKFTP